MDCSVCRAPGMCVCGKPNEAPSTALREIEVEIARAQKRFPPLNSAHEGFAVLMEEVDELKAHVWTNQARRDVSAMRKEAVQVAAMAGRFILDVCDGGRGRR